MWVRFWSTKIFSWVRVSSVDMQSKHAPEILNALNDGRNSHTAAHTQCNQTGRQIQAF